MPNFDNLKKQAKLLVRWHRDGNRSVGGRVRASLPRYRELTDLQILAREFPLAEAQEIIARESGFESWAALKTGVETMPDLPRSGVAIPALITGCPQLFVADINASCRFFREKLGFKIVFVHGEPPFYAQVIRDGVRLNLRFVHDPVFAGDVREREGLLSAYIDVAHLKDLYAEFLAAGADIAQTLRKQPWDVQDFIVRDPDGNLICFAS
jgi:catechol 2,3-dioxygenase-like lactoylglutathione lyase family enzyme